MQEPAAQKMDSLRPQLQQKGETGRPHLLLDRCPKAQHLMKTSPLEAAGCTLGQSSDHGELTRQTYLG